MTTLLLVVGGVIGVIALGSVLVLWLDYRAWRSHMARPDVQQLRADLHAAGEMHAPSYLDD